MPSVDAFGEYLRVAGLADGTDWMYLPERRAELHGVVGPAHAWHVDRDARLRQLDVPARGLAASLTLDGAPAWSPRSLLVSASRDGRALYVVQWRGARGQAEGRGFVVDVARGGDLFSDGEEGIGMLGRAVRAFATLDASALPTIHRYGALLDVEHERWLTDDTVPAVIAAHGRADDVVDFVLWVLAWNFYNARQDDARVWRAWGLRDAMVQREARAFARHVAAELAATMRRRDDPGEYGIAGLDRLARRIRQPNEAWVVVFLDELRQRVADLDRTEA